MSNFGCGGGGGGGTTDAPVDKVDAKDGGTGGTDAVKPDTGTGGTAGDSGATDKPDATDAADASDAPKDVADAAEVATDTAKDATDGGDGGETGPEAGTCPVTPVCTLTNKRCGPNGGVQTCITVAGCPDWSAETACGGHQACSNGVCGCVAEARCTVEGPFCDSNGNLGACAKDGTCLFVSTAPAACAAGKVCGGANGAAACSCATNACNGAASVTCTDSNTLQTCAAGANGCFVPTTVTCGPVKTCQTNACACPAAGVHVGNGCTLQSPSICEGANILTCTHDDDTSCNIWKITDQCDVDASARANNPHPGSLTCGKGPTGNGPAACQCNANAGTTMYADPVAGSDAVTSAAARYPTGVLDPPACRFATLAQALGTAGVTKVIAVSDAAATTPVTFASEPSFPLNVKPNVILMSADNTPGHYSITLNKAGGSGIALQAGAIVQGFTLTGVNPGVTGSAITTFSGANATIDTVVINANQNVVHGISVGSTGTADVKNVTIDSTSGSAVDAVGITSVTISGGSKISHSVIGLNVQVGTATVTDTTFDTNQVGIRAIDSPLSIVNLSNSSVLKSTAVGAAIVQGALIADQTVTIDGSGADGIIASGGAHVTLTGSSVTNNTGNGITASSATTVVAITGGAHVDSNKAAGVVASNAGTAQTPGLMVGGSSTVSKNTTDGIQLLGAIATVAGATIDSNGGNGIDINSPGGVSINIGANGSTTTISNNTLAGILIEKTLQTANHTISTSIANVDVTSNKKEGIFVNPVAAADALWFLQDSRVLQNGGVGVRIKAQPAKLTDSSLVHNEVASNGAPSATATGGILFEDSSTLSSFLGNNVHHNTGNQVGFLAAQTPDATRSPPLTTQWIIKGPMACTDATKNNTFNGYSPPTTTGVFTNSVAITVDATYNHWQSGPSAGFDFSSGGGITALPACP